MTSDFIIIGAGTAGMVCAIEAARNRVHVAVIEKDRKPGGALHWSGGHMSGGGTIVQKRNNIDDSPEDHYADILRINGGTGDLDLIKLAVNEAPHTLDWLDSLGFDWDGACPRIIYGHVPYTKPRTHYGANKAISIYNVIKPLWDKAISDGYIHFYPEHTLEEIKKDLNGKHVAICSTLDNKKVEFSANKIVLSTGGYGSNADMFARRHPNVPYNSACYPNSTGEGLLVMENIGAKFRMADYHLPSLGGIELEPNSGRADFNKAWAMVLTSVYRRPRDIYVNKEGRRFMNEDEINADTRERLVMEQEGWCFWVIFDEASLVETDENGINNPIVIGWTPEQIKAEAKKNRAICMAETIEELGALTGINVENLVKTVGEYNLVVKYGMDVDYNRSYLKNKIESPPYYAVKVHASTLVTFGGLEVNNDFELIDKEGKVISGLYAIGEALGLGATSGNTFCSGMAITPALSFGRILGKKLTS